MVATRKYGGKTYTLRGGIKPKRGAELQAKAIRGRGGSARIVKAGTVGYVVFARGG